MPLDPEATLIPMLYDSCTYLDVAELGDSTECSLCTENFGWGTDSETPVRLRCGHIFGLKCIREWVSTHTGPGHRYPPCPNCRADFLNLGAGSSSAPRRPLQVQSTAGSHSAPRRPPQAQSLDSQQEDASPTPSAPNARSEDTPRGTGRGHSTLFSRAIESRRQASNAPIEERIERWVQSVSLGFRLITSDERQWIRRTEYLWLAVYDAALQSPGYQVARALLPWHSVYDIYGALVYPSSRSVDKAADAIRDLEIHVSEPWWDLMEHLEKASEIGIGDGEFKILGFKRMNYPWLDEHKQRLRRYWGSGIQNP
ncbi:MAG: hypothetical protein Q9219_007073 [cf. Caloplaca sp. 3 TL-2023]